MKYIISQLASINNEGLPEEIHSLRLKLSEIKDIKKPDSRQVFLLLVPVCLLKTIFTLW